MNGTNITIGEYAGHHFNGQSDLTCAYHATRTDCYGNETKGFFLKRRWLFDRAAFNYDPTMGWACEHWFEWPTEASES